MRILCLTSRLPYPPYGGDRLRTFHIIEHLSREHELSLASFIASPYERDHLIPFRSLCRDVRVVLMRPFVSALQVLFNLWRSEPMQALYYRCAEMHRLINHMVCDNRFDAVYVHLFRMAPYVSEFSHLYRIVDMTDIISREVACSLPYRKGVSRLIYQLEQPRMNRYEKWVAEHFEEIWLISEAERRSIASECPRGNFQIVTNGVDSESFRPTGRQYNAKTLVFVGNLHTFHNANAAICLARKILPLVRQKVPDCRLYIVGVNPGPSVLRLEKDPAVIVTGFVPDLNELLNRSTVFVAPMRVARGIQNKVLEAMAAGRPVVTTSHVNMGLGAQPGRHLFIADDAQTMANQIVMLLRDEELRKKIGHEAREFVLRTFSWDNVVQRMKNIEKTMSK